MGFTGTPAAEATERLLEKEFGSAIIGVGQYNRRMISGTDTWSEHSWGNALDLRVSKGTATGVEKENGDAIASFLRSNAEAFGIRNVIWWKKNHWGHIHTDFWPRGHGTPPESTVGIGQFRYSNGIVVTSQIQKVTPEGDFDGVVVPDFEEEEVEELVRHLQETLIAAGQDPGAVDGLWGPKTQAAFVAALSANGAVGERGPQGERGPSGKLEVTVV